jgi:hypothetical protein
MRDGTPCSIRILSACTHRGLTLYQLEVNSRGERRLLALRYSALRDVAALLPRVSEAKFPSPQHLASLFSHLIGKTDFWLERLRQLTHFFTVVSSAPGLE